MEMFLGERFEIVRELGRGSRGVVYLAADRNKGSEVALKVFPFISSSRLGSAASAVEQFQNEFTILSRLHDPSLAEIYEIGFDPDKNSYFLAEEYFDGEPLSRWSGRLGFQKLAEITARICRVLQFLHNEGIFHGDLKPNNILIRENNIKLVDFGLAGRFDLVSPQERGETTVSGTLPYMAPELFLGAPVDGRSDLYSLGATLYEVVRGHPPFEAPSASALVEKHLFETPINPIPEGSALPREFGFLILRLLNKDPSDRFEEANDVIRALNLQFHFEFPLGPEKPALSPEREKELQERHGARLYEQAARFYKERLNERDDPETRRLLAEIYYRQGNWDEAENLLAGLSGHRVDLLRLQIGLKKGRFESVREEGVRLVQMQDKLEEPQRGLLANTLGTAHYYLGHYEESEEAFRGAFSSYERTQDRAARAALLNNLANLRIREGKWDEAVRLYQESIALCRERGDVVNEGLFLMSLGYAYHLKERHEEALSHYRQSEALLEAIGYRVGVAKVKSNLANLFITIGSLEKGEEKLRQSEEIALEEGDRFLVAYSRLLAGDLLKKKGKPAEALAAYREGKRLFHELKSSNEEAIADKNIAEIGEEFDKGKSAEVEALPAPTTALPLLKRVLSINRRISLLQDVQEILETIIDSMIELTGAERGYLILREGGKNVVKVTRNLGEEASGKEEGFSSSLVERALKTGEPIVTLDAMTDERFLLSLSVHKLRLRSIVCIPLHVREAVIGAIYLDNRLQSGAFSEATIELLQAFVDQAAIAIANATAFEELKTGAAEIRKSHEELKRSKEEIEGLNKQLQAALSEKEMQLSQAKNSLVQKQSALELKYRYDEIVGRSPRMMEVLQLMDRVIDSDVPVFLHGESGTGKELMARAIHFNGPRAKGPFIPVNCSAIPETLLEAELFGYVRGAFTGAVRDHDGYFETADGGTLFLDEIGDMTPAMQVKLLRVLEDGVVRRIGSDAPVQVNVRLISASNRDLKVLVQEQKFREDLFYRIQGISLNLPPLKERMEDLPFLIDHILEKIAKERRTEKKTLTRGAFDLLAAYSWPGNVRELENTISSACILAQGSRIEPDELKHKEELFPKGMSTLLQGTSELSFRESVRAFEKGLISRALQECQGNVSRAAKKLQIARPQLSHLVKRYGLKSNES